MDFLEIIDSGIYDIFSAWNIYTAVLALLLSAVVVQTIASAVDADIHPMILQRQASAARVRQPGESAVYRAPEVPEGMPLRSGLAVKLPTDKMYSSGRDGDLRFVWKRVIGEIALPPIPGTAQVPPKKQEILSVRGKEEIENYRIKDLTQQIAVIGDHLSKHGGKRIAIYLPNSVEFLNTLFATAFFGLSVILIPYNLPHPTIVSILKTTNADGLIAAAGSIPLEMLSKAKSSVKQLIWVVEKTSRHMDWTEVPEGLGGSIDVSVWHELVQDHSGDAPPFPELKSDQLGKIITLWDSESLQSGTKSPTNEVVEFTHGNFVAAIASLLAALPARQRLNAHDLFLSADSFTNSYALCLTLGALFSGASLAITSVAGPNADLTFAAKRIAPTVVVTSAQSAAELHAASAPKVKSGIPKLAHAFQSRSLQAGNMPSGGILSSNATKSLIGSTPGSLRLLFISNKAQTTNAPLSSQDLSDLRIFTGARVVYALTAAPVAGAVAQTHVYDYRSDEQNRNKNSHFGIPLSCLEVKLVDSGDHKTTNEKIEGQIVVAGHSVAGGEANLGVLGRFNDDCTLSSLY